MSNPLSWFCCSLLVSRKCEITTLKWHWGEHVSPPPCERCVRSCRLHNRAPEALIKGSTVASFVCFCYPSLKYSMFSFKQVMWAFLKIILFTVKIWEHSHKDPHQAPFIHVAAALTVRWKQAVACLFLRALWRLWLPQTRLWWLLAVHGLGLDWWHLNLSGLSCSLWTPCPPSTV